MEIPSFANIKTSSLLKIGGIAIIAVILVVFMVSIIGSSFSVISGKRLSISSSPKAAPAYDSSEGYANDSATYGESGGIGLSARNVGIVSPEPPADHGVPGDDAEEYEVTEYYVFIETRDKEDACGAFEQLKPLDYVIFERANTHESGCNYTFKVASKHVQEIIDLVEQLDPKEFSESTYTIKRLVEDYTSETDILEKKKASIEETLEDAISAYDDITGVAARTQDAESLAKIIDSKIGIIERLTQQKININAQLERLARSKAEQLDRLLYTSFTVNITESKYVDATQLKDSWKIAIKSFVRNVNHAVQDMSINLAAFLFLALQYAVYFFILLFAAKYGWRLVRRIWKA